MNDGAGLPFAVRPNKAERLRPHRLRAQIAGARQT